jgi:excisionase family DNA binding protein
VTPREPGRGRPDPANPSLNQPPPSDSQPTMRRRERALLGAVRSQKGRRMPEVRDGRSLDGTEHRTKDPGVAIKGSPASVRRLLFLKEAAAILGTSTATVRRLVSTGKLPVVRLTRRVQIDMRDLERLVDRSKATLGF